MDVVEAERSKGAVRQPCEASPEKAALVREMLVRLADRWTLLVIDALEDEESLRFSRLQQRVEGISQRMLTKTLRQLERDGLVTRKVHPVVPPHVDYSLTPLGLGLSYSLCGLWMWVGSNLEAIDSARERYDEAQAAL